jgi:hypothetical protein
VDRGRLHLRAGGSRPPRPGAHAPGESDPVGEEKGVVSGLGRRRRSIGKGRAAGDEEPWRRCSLTWLMADDWKDESKREVLGLGKPQSPPLACLDGCGEVACGSGVRLIRCWWWYVATVFWIDRAGGDAMDAAIAVRENAREREEHERRLIQKGYARRRGGEWGEGAGAEEKS